MEQGQQSSSEVYPVDSLLRFPNEILYQICDSMLESDNGAPDKKSLASLGRTCKLLHEIVMPSLFRRLETAEPIKTFASLQSIIKRKRTALVRSANLSHDTRCGPHEPRVLHHPTCPNKGGQIEQGECKKPSLCREYGFGLLPSLSDIRKEHPYAQLLRITHVGYQQRFIDQVDRQPLIYNIPTSSLVRRNQGVRTAKETRRELGVVVVLALSVLPNLSKVRVPINGGTLRLRSLDEVRYPIVVDGNSQRVFLEKEHFAPLPKLRELDLDFTSPEPEKALLHPGNISWIIQRAPKLVALRLICNGGLSMAERPWSCPTIERLSMIACSTSCRDIVRLVESCPQLRHFKMARIELLESNMTRREITRGPIGRFVASLMLKKLAQVAPRLETIFLHANFLDRLTLRTEWPLEDDPVISAAGFASLKTLSLARQNLFEPHGDKQRDVHVLADLVAGCPTLEKLHIFRNEAKCTFCGSALYRSLQALFDDLARKKISGLREIKLWDFDSYNDWAVDKWDSGGSQHKRSNDPYYASEERLLRAAGMALTDLIPPFESLGITFKYELGTGAEENSACHGWQK